MAIACVFAFVSCNNFNRIDTDILIVGGGASGTAAALQAARMGANVVIVEPTPWLGGMLTSAGVSAVDGNKRLPAGIFGEFHCRLASHYGGPDSLRTGWVSSVLFEPSVGDSIFKSMVNDYPNIRVIYNACPDTIYKNGNYWKAEITGDNNLRFNISSHILIDGTELGDVAAYLGVPYDIGMEARSQTLEDIAPEVSNNIIQDMTMVAILKDYGTDVTIAQPEGYDPDEFACTCINPHCMSPKEPDRMWEPGMMITYGKLPNGKYMINWPIEGNDYYANMIEMSPEEREDIIEEAKEKTLRYLYFIQKELGYNTLGLADDEFPTKDSLPFYPYHRESRRIHGKVRFDLNHIMTPYATEDPLYRTAIAVGDYPVDHHHKAYSGPEELPDLHFHPVPSFGVPLGVIMPENEDNLLVTEKSVSVSNIVNGTTRLQPVVVQIGQAAGAVAAIAVKNDISTTEVSVRNVQNAILDAGGYLLPFLDVEKDDERFKSYQRIGVTGILQGQGQSIAWSNETWLRADDPVIVADVNGLLSFYDMPGIPESSNEILTLERLCLLVDLGMTPQAVSEKTGIELSDTKPLTRGEYAIIIDKILDPFNNVPVDIYGNIVRE
ncbi:MAG: FAD-dependent oxidoreductase [Muribaculaceae bacterium]|nr:FAD-dependent oxidoreductase [Muribaculaceae bacterium]